MHKKAYRRYQTRRLIEELKRQRAATLIQKIVRRWIAIRLFVQARAAAVKIQSTYRMHVASRQTARLRENRAALRIQKVFRGSCARRWYKRATARIVLLQSCVRRRQARKELRRRKNEAKSLGRLRELNYTLENKVVELSLALVGRDEESRTMADRVAVLEAQVVLWRDKVAIILFIF